MSTTYKVVNEWGGEVIGEHQKLSDAIIQHEQAYAMARKAKACPFLGYRIKRSDELECSGNEYWAAEMEAEAKRIGFDTYENTFTK